MYRIFNLNENQQLGGSILLLRPSHRYPTANRNRFLTPFPRVDAIRINYEYQFIEAWNKIHDSIRASESLKLFKRELSQYFLSTN